MTFSKGFGVSDVAILCFGSATDYPLQFARHPIYSTSMSPAQAQALCVTLTMIRNHEGDERREKLAMLIQRFRAGVNTMDLALTHSDNAIQPLIIGDNHKAL